MAEIGGLFILFKFSIALGFLHEYLFNCKMQRKHKAINGEKAEDFKDVYSYDNIKHALDTIQEMKQKIATIEAMLAAKDQDSSEANVLPGNSSEWLIHT